MIWCRPCSISSSPGANPTKPYVDYAQLFKTLYIIELFDTYLPQQTGLKILEIGGAPGQFLAYLAKEFGYSAHAIDYSSIGCDKTLEAFEGVNLDLTIWNRDIFCDISDLPLFDIVFSMGFIEHFNDLDAIVGKHVELLK